MPIEQMPAAEAEVSAELVVSLLQDQWPGWRRQEVQWLESGWDNFSYRVGSDHVARLPRRLVAVELLENEARWLPDLAKRLPLPIPAPVFVGEPGGGYPWRWSLVPHIDGRSAAIETDIDHEAAARQLAGFLSALHIPAPPDAPRNPYRGVPLRERDQAVRRRLSELVGHVDERRAVTAWEEALQARPFDGDALWLHGDLHPHNLLVRGGALSGVVDFGDLTAGDPATDLAVMWSLLPRSIHEIFRDEYGTDGPDLWARARGWGLSLGLAYLGSSASNPVMSRIGETVLHSLDVV